jgi:hypothetical protein
MIHSLFILQESGVGIYSRHFSEEFKDLQTNLVTPFISAIISFSERVMSKNLEVLEMRELRFVLRKEKDYIFVILSDTGENLLFINSRLEKLVDLFFRVYEQLIKEDSYERGVQFINDPKFNDLVSSLIEGKHDVDQITHHKNYQNIINYFSDLISEREILGSALLTNKGTIIYSSLTDDALLRAMRELEIRYMSGTFDMPELFYTLGNGQKICERIISYKNFINLLLIIQFTKETTLGMMDYMAETIVEKIKGFF